VENPQVLTEIMRLTTNVLLTDKELPVKGEADVANVFNVSGKFKWKIRIKEITFELLTIIRETENEDFNF
jgi:importin-7